MAEDLGVIPRSGPTWEEADASLVGADLWSPPTLPPRPEPDRTECAEETWDWPTQEPPPRPPRASLLPVLAVSAFLASTIIAAAAFLLIVAG